MLCSREVGVSPGYAEMLVSTVRHANVSVYVVSYNATHNVCKQIIITHSQVCDHLVSEWLSRDKVQDLIPCAHISTV